jgi:hypothetical protein
MSLAKRGWTILAAALTYVALISSAEAAISVNTLYNTTSLQLKVTGLPSSYVGSPLTLANPAFGTTGCNFSVDGADFQRCDIINKLLVVPLDSATYTGADISIDVKLPTNFDETAFASGLKATISATSFGTVPFFAPADTSVESRAFLTRATTQETLDLVVYPTALRPETAADDAADERGHNIVIVLPPRFSLQSSISCSVKVDAATEFSRPVPTSVPSSLPTIDLTASANVTAQATRISDGRLVARLTARYGTGKAPAWRANALMPIYVSCVIDTSEQVTPDNAALETVEIYISRGLTLGTMDYVLFPYRANAALHGPLAVQLPARVLERLTSSTVYAVRFRLNAMNARLSDFARISVTFESPAIFAVDETEVTVLFSTKDNTVSAADYVVRNSLTERILFANPNAFSRIDADSPKIFTVPAGKWECRDVSGVKIECPARTTQACTTLASAVTVHCADSAGIDLPATHCAPNLYPTLAGSIDTSACGSWVCKLPNADEYRACGSDHQECDSTGCSITVSSATWISGSEPACRTASGSIVTEAAAVDLHCPSHIVTKPTLKGTCARRDDCVHACRDQTYTEDIAMMRLVSCEDAAAWSGSCTTSATGSQSRLPVCVPKSVPLNTPVSTQSAVTFANCDHLGPRAVSRSCASCTAADSWETWVTYETSEIALSDSATLDPLRTGAARNQFYTNRKCEWNPYTKEAVHTPLLTCKCPEPTGVATSTLSVIDQSASMCSDAPSAFSQFADPACTSGSISYMCAKSLTTNVTELRQCDFNPGSIIEDGAPLAGFNECPTTGCGTPIVTRVLHCAIFVGYNNANNAIVDINLCAHLPRPVESAKCPPVSSACIPAVLNPTTCREVDLTKTDGSFVDDEPHPCDFSLPGLPRQYVAPGAQCYSGASGEVESSVLCAKDAPNSYVSSGETLKAATARALCRLPACALDKREWRLNTTLGSCQTSPTENRCKSYRKKTTKCMTREIASSASADVHGAEEVPLEFCRKAHVAGVPDSEITYEACDLEDCGAGVQCRLSPAFVTGSVDGLVVPEGRGVCECANGNVGTACDVAPELLSVSFIPSPAPADGPVLTVATTFTFVSASARSLTQSVTVQLVSGATEAAAAAPEATIVATAEYFFAENGELSHVLPLPSRLPHGRYYTVRISTSKSSAVAGSTFFVDAACANKCGSHGTCNNTTQICNCAPGFTGDFCEHDVCAATCTGPREACEVDADFETTGAVTCSCEGTFSKFNGDTCDYNDLYCENEMGDPKCEHGSRQVTVSGSGVITCGNCECEENYLGHTCRVCSIKCRNGGEASPSQCRACICPGGYGGSHCEQRGYALTFAVNINHASVSSWYAETESGALIGQTVVQNYAKTLESAVTTFLNNKMMPKSAAFAARFAVAAVASATTGAFASVTGVLRGTGSAAGLLSIKMQLSHADADIIYPADSVSGPVHGPLAVAVLDQAYGYLKEAFVTGSFGSSAPTPLGGISTGHGIGVSDPQCTYDCPQSVGDAGVVPTENGPTEPANDSSSGLSDGELAAVIVCSVVGGTLLIAFIVAAATGSYCFSKGSSSDSKSTMSVEMR